MSQRYIRLAGIQCQQILYATDITHNNVHQIPTKHLAKHTGITIQYCFLQDTTGKRYPLVLDIAHKLLRQGILVRWMRRGWNIYWMGDKASQPHITLMPVIEHCYRTI